MIKGKIMENNSKKKVCNACGHSFINKSNLRRHVLQFHHSKVNELAPLSLKVSSNFKFSCEICGRNFNYKKHLRYHMKIHNAHQVEETSRKQCKKCPMCEYRTNFRNDMHIHFNEVHNILVLSKEITFSSLDEFYEWKAQIETDTNSKFVKDTGDSRTRSRNVYICHRSGNYAPKGKGIRPLKRLGSCKIEGFCPAAMKLIVDEQGKCKIEFVETHVGHENDLGHLTLTSLERKELAQKISSKIPYNSIMDEIADSVPNSNLKRIHLLTRQDLYNIEKSFDLSSTAVRHSNDAVSVEQVQFTQLKQEENHNGEEEPHSTTSNEEDEKKLFIHCPSNETITILVESSQKTINQRMEAEKEEIMQNLRRQLDKIHSPSQFAIVRRIMAPLSPTLSAAIKANSTITLPKPSKIAPNAKISAQRRLRSTKKKTKKPENPIKNQE